jgi:DNA-binding NarL/FixJ family response regulator
LLINCEKAGKMSKIRVVILEDHLSIIDGYLFRLSKVPEIEVVGTARYGDELEPMLDEHPADVLLLDINVPVSPDNSNTFPVLHLIPRLLKKHPGLSILVISMFNQHSLIEALVDCGVSGYILKDDSLSIQQLGKIVTMIASGGIYFSQDAYRDSRDEPTKTSLTTRQLQALSLCSTYPDSSTHALSRELGISGSTLRNLLSGAYLRLGVRTRAAAIAKAYQLGLIPPPSQSYTDAEGQDE